MAPLSANGVAPTDHKNRAHCGGDPSRSGGIALAPMGVRRLTGVSLSPLSSELLSDELRPACVNDVSASADVLLVWLEERSEVRAVTVDSKSHVLGPFVQIAGDRVRLPWMSVNDDRHCLTQLLVDRVERRQVVALAKAEVEAGAQLTADLGSRFCPEVRRTCEFLGRVETRPDDVRTGWRQSCRVANKPDDRPRTTALWLKTEVNDQRPAQAAAGQLAVQLSLKRPSERGEVAEVEVVADEGVIEPE